MGSRFRIDILRISNAIASERILLTIGRLPVFEAEALHAQ
jgi:hypothetical protein